MSLLYFLRSIMVLESRRFMGFWVARGACSPQHHRRLPPTLDHLLLHDDFLLLMLTLVTESMRLGTHAYHTTGAISLSCLVATIVIFRSHPPPSRPINLAPPPMRDRPSSERYHIIQAFQPSHELSCLVSFYPVHCSFFCYFSFRFHDPAPECKLELCAHMETLWRENGLCGPVSSHPLTRPTYLWSVASRSCRRQGHGGLYSHGLQRMGALWMTDPDGCSCCR